MIKRAVQTCFYGRHLFSSPAGTTLHNNKSCNFRLRASSTRLQLTSLYSTLPSAQNPHSPSDASDSVQDQIEKEIPSNVVEDVSKEEFKELIHKYDAGDENALPSIFEAILKRKLSGKHDESDEELMEELRMKSPRYHSDIETEGDIEELHSSDDEESDD